MTPLRRRVVRAWPPLAIVLAVLALTWPQAAFITRAPGHVDAYFSMWRLAWVAHALTTQPDRVFDANIFHPARNTLALSDAMLLQGALAAPLFWAGLPAVAVYNLLLLAGLAGSGLAMFALVRRLTGADAPALLAGVIYALAPYRFEHYMHLELQWAMWIPLAFWALHRTVEERSWRFGLLSGVFLWLQVLSSVYYGVFLAIAMTVFAPLLLIGRSLRHAAAAVPRFAAGGILAALLVVPYALPYLAAGRQVGSRPPAEVQAYSAKAVSYLASPPQNWLWGWTAERWGGVELNLFPGALAAGLALLGLAHAARRTAFAYAVLALLAFELSRGLNGSLYAWLFDRVEALQGLRAPARFGIVTLCALAVLAAFGCQVIARRRIAASPKAQRWLLAAGLVVLAAEYRTTDLRITSAAPTHPDLYSVYAAIRSLGPGVVLDLPLPRLDRLPGREALYAFWSLQHWHPLVNGYSGYYPPEYLQSVVRLERFPDDRSLQQLALLDVRYIVVHRAHYDDAEYTRLMLEMAARPELKRLGTFRDPDGDAELFFVNR